jgi:hypothetical protein
MATRFTQFGEGDEVQNDPEPSYSELAHSALVKVVQRNNRLLAQLEATTRLDSANRQALQQQQQENRAALDTFGDAEDGTILLDVQL